MVKINNNTYSHTIKVTSGVPQSSVLYFFIFINDVSSIYDDLDVKLKLFADDIKLYIPLMICVVLNLIFPQLLIVGMIRGAPGNCKFQVKNVLLSLSLPKTKT